MAGRDHLCPLLSTDPYPRHAPTDPLAGASSLYESAAPTDPTIQVSWGNRWKSRSRTAKRSGPGEGATPRAAHTENMQLHTEEQIGSFIHCNASACSCSYVQLYDSAAAAGGQM